MNAVLLPSQYIKVAIDAINSAVNAIVLLTRCVYIALENS